MVAVCISAMLWQLDRRDQRMERNELIGARIQGPALTISEALTGGTPAEINFQRVEDRGRWVSPEVVRVANRSQAGQAGQWTVGLFETRSGERILVNRGFIALNAESEPPVDAATITGWLQQSRVREGLAVADSGEGPLVPRLNVADIAKRLTDPSVVPVWLQLDSPAPQGYPVPVPLPTLDAGPHLSYAVQWAIFAVLGMIVYTLVLRRVAGGQSHAQPSR